MAPLGIFGYMWSFEAISKNSDSGFPTGRNGKSVSNVAVSQPSDEGGIAVSREGHGRPLFRLPNSARADQLGPSSGPTPPRRVHTHAAPAKVTRYRTAFQRGLCCRRQ